MSRWGCGVGAHALRRVLTKIPSRPAMVEVGARSSGNKPAEEFLPASYGLPGTSSTRRRQTDVGPLLRAASLPETTESERTFLCLSPPRRPCALRPASSCAFRSTTWVGGWPVAGPNGNPTRLNDGSSPFYGHGQSKRSCQTFLRCVPVSEDSEERAGARAGSFSFFSF